VEVVADDGTTLVLDAGSGIVHCRAAGQTSGRIDVLLTHLHMDHIQGLGFFAPLRLAEVDVHLWGPVSTTNSLSARLSRYLSPPLFPVRLRELPSLTVHDLAPGTVEIGPFTVTADFVIHPGPTHGFRLSADGSTLAYLPDHEPALGNGRVPADPAWISGFDLAQGVDLLLHDAQYTEAEYRERVGWGHSTLAHTLDLAEAASVGRLVTFHHAPDHSDALIDRMHDEAREERARGIPFEPGHTGAAYAL
jgi:ribonuclease BN (tRNA processing enzyme)